MAPTTLPLRMFAQRRAFSAFARARSAAHPHAFEGYPASSRGSAKADWGKQFRHVADVGMFFFPAMGLFLSWPILSAKVLDGHM